MTAHARFAPSAAHRWIRCPGSVQLYERLPQERTSIYAAEGRFFHEIAAECLERDLEPADLIGETRTLDGFEFTFDRDMAGHLEPGLDRLRELIAGAEAVVIEKRVEFGDVLPGQFGTCDCGWLYPTRREVGVWDWKYGAGVPVSPVENEQMMLYAIGLIHHLKASERPDWDSDWIVRLFVEQPRAPGGGGEWTTTVGELAAFGAKATEAAELAKRKNPPFVPGEKQCRFCDARNICTAFAEYTLDLFSLKFEDLDAEGPPELPKQLTPERRSYVLLHSELFTQWLDGLRADALHDALTGGPVPGMKAVYGRRPPRKWTSEDEAAAWLLARLPHNEAYDYTLKSPTQAEKILSGDDFPSHLVDQGAPRPVLVPETDKRPAIKPVAEQFDDLDDIDSLV